MQFLAIPEKNWQNLNSLGMNGLDGFSPDKNGGKKEGCNRRGKKNIRK